MRMLSDNMPVIHYFTTLGLDVMRRDRERTMGR